MTSSASCSTSDSPAVYTCEQLYLMHCSRARDVDGITASLLRLNPKFNPALTKVDKAEEGGRERERKREEKVRIHAKQQSE